MLLADRIHLEEEEEDGEVHFFQLLLDHCLSTLHQRLLPMEVEDDFDLIETILSGSFTAHRVLDDNF
jgi:uncharacterized protein YrzB (UPF0473 family)